MPDLAEIPAALANPEPTAEKRVRLYNAARRRQPRVPIAEKPATVTVPGLDIAALAAKYGGDPANTTQTRIGTFKVPIGITWERWERIRNVAFGRFKKALESQGWVVAQMVARPGVYPYRDTLTQVDDPDFREMQIVATGGYPKAERTVIELDAEDVEALTLTR